MIRGSIKEESIDIDEIMSYTNGGYDIYMYYLGKVHRCMDRPWGKREKHSSWGIYSYNKLWMWKDHATEESGNAIQFVERYFNISFTEALKKVASDFGLKNIKSSAIRKVPITWEVPDEDDYMDIKFFSKPFGKKHHEFWNIAEVTEDDCKRRNCFAVKDLAINNKKVFIGRDEIVFAYYAPEEDGVKIYFPERQKKDRFRNNVSYHYLWNFNNLSDCENLIVQKSMKDLIVTSLIEPCCTATQAEAVKIFNKEVVDKINSVSRTPWIWYGSDWDGVKKCKEITDTLGWKYINTPKSLLPEINDAYGYASKFKLKGLEEFMKSKKLII